MSTAVTMSRKERYAASLAAAKVSVSAAADPGVLDRAIAWAKRAAGPHANRTQIEGQLQNAWFNMAEVKSAFKTRQEFMQAAMAKLPAGASVSAAAPPPKPPAQPAPAPPAPPEPSADEPPAAPPPNSRRANYMRAKYAGTLASKQPATGSQPAAQASIAAAAGGTPKVGDTITFVTRQSFGGRADPMKKTETGRVVKVYQDGTVELDGDKGTVAIKDIKSIKPAAQAAHVPDDGSGAVPAKNWFGKPKPPVVPAPAKKPDAAAANVAAAGKQYALYFEDKWNSLRRPDKKGQVNKTGWLQSGGKTMMFATPDEAKAMAQRLNRQESTRGGDTNRLYYVKAAPVGASTASAGVVSAAGGSVWYVATVTTWTLVRANSAEEAKTKAVPELKKLQGREAPIHTVRKATDDEIEQLKHHYQNIKRPVDFSAKASVSATAGDDAPVWTVVSVQTGQAVSKPVTRAMAEKIVQRLQQTGGTYQIKRGAGASRTVSAAVVKQMDHAAYQQALKTKTPAELQYIIKDAREAMQAMPQGPNAGYYQDEIHYAAMELKKRQGAKASASQTVAASPADQGRQAAMRDNQFYGKLQGLAPTAKALMKTAHELMSMAQAGTDSTAKNLAGRVYQAAGDLQSAIGAVR